MQTQYLTPVKWLISFIFTGILVTFLLCADTFAQSTFKSDGNLFVDTATIKDGYLTVKIENKENKKYKLNVKYENSSILYDIKEKEKIPLQFGNGTYSLSLYKNVSDMRYANDGKMEINVSGMDENEPFLHPNQYVDYKEEDVSILPENAEEKMSEEEIFYAVCWYMKNNFSYDFIKSEIVSQGILPNIEECMETKKGICQDLAATATAILRAYDIPAKFVIGYADGKYHAWTEAVIDGNTLSFDPTDMLLRMHISKYIPERFY